MLRAIAVVAALLLSGTTVAADEPPVRLPPPVQCYGAPPWWGPATSTVYLPNITRRLGGPTGFYTPFIIQNTGATEAQLEVTFYKFSDGVCAEQYLVSNLAPGRAHSNDPNDDGRNPFLPDAQFSVVVRSFGSTIVGVVNEHQGSGDRAEALSYNGFNAGAKTVYLPNIVRKFFGLFDTPFIMQNLGVAAISPKITFTPLLNHPGIANTYTFPLTQPGSSKAFDPRFSFSTQGTTNVVCGTGGGDCLANGTYSFKIEAPGGKIAAQVNSTTAISGTGYSATASPAPKLYAPNVPLGLCYCPVPNITAGWTGTIYLQPVTATSATLRWYTVPGGVLAHTDTVQLEHPTATTIVNGWFTPGLTPDRQYSVVIETGGGTIAAIVSQWAPGADNTAIYEAFAAP